MPAGGTPLFLVTKPSSSFGILPRTGQEYTRVFDETIAIADQARALGVQVFVVLGIHPAEITRLSAAGSLPGAVAAMKKGLDGAASYIAEGKAVALNPATGTAVWEFATGGAAVETPCVGDDGTVYLGVGTRVYALKADGTEKWSFDLGSKADGPSVGPDDNIYAGSVGGKIVALSPSGALEWEASVPGSIRSPSFDKKGNLLCSAATLCMYAFDSKGRKLWEFKPEGDLPVYPGLFDWANTLDTPSVGSDGTIYAGSYHSPNMTTSATQIPDYAVSPQAKVYGISSGGVKKWEFVSTYECGSTLHTPSIGADGTLYAGTSCWRVIALNPANGTLKWEFNTGEGQGVCPSIWSPSIGKDGLLYAATTSAKIFCITPEGTEKWRYQGPEPWLPNYGGSNGFTPQPINEDGVMFSVLCEGKVFAFKTAAAQ